MIVVMVVPTGIGAEIGGHAGDANPAARLLASVCDTFITHPNVVNASDIMELPENGLYVEGSFLDRFLEGKIDLRPVKQNKILVAVNGPVKPETINAVSAARATLGIDASIVELDKPLEMIGTIEGGRASGDVKGWLALVEQLKQYEFDALAITTPVMVARETMLNYLRNGGVNPWGKVEAILSKLVADAINKPVAHSPVEEVEIEDEELYFFTKDEIVDVRFAAEAISYTYLYCIMKGLHKAPRIGKGISVDQVDCLVTPINCVGPPHRACMERGIPIIAVRENKTCLNDIMPSSFIVVDNYLEAAGLIACMRMGMDWRSVRRPLEKTQIINRKVGELCQ